MELIFKPNTDQFRQAKKAIALIDAEGTKESTPSVIMVSKLAKKIKKINVPVTRFFENPQQVYSQYGEAEYDLTSVFKLLKYEPIFLKSVQKKLSLLVKSGYMVYSEDEKIKEYMNARFDYMALQTGKSLQHLIKRIAYYLVVCSNAFVVKVRDKDCEFAESYFKDSKELHPVVGLFLAHPTSMKPKFKPVSIGKGQYRLEIDKWIHSNHAGLRKEFSVEDVAHFQLNKEDGMVFGMPEVIPAIDDVRTLRKLEEDVQLLFYRDLFPIIHYGIERPGEIDHKSGWTEIDQAKQDMQSLIQDGGIATDSRHEIKFIGSEGKGLDPKPFLDYFRERVFTGLGVSSTDMGIGQDISGNTATSMSKQLTDAVRWVQQELAQQFNELILTEMVLQSPFGIEAFQEGSMPILKFIETDIEWKIRKENHEVDLFAKGIKDIDEARAAIGLTPMADEQLAKTYQGLYGQMQVDQDIEAQEHMTKQVGGQKKAPGNWNNPTSTGTSKSSADKDIIKSNKTNSNVVKSNRDFKLIDSAVSIDLQDQFKSLVKDGSKLDIIIATKYVYEAIKDNMHDSFNAGAREARKDLNINIEDSTPIMHNIFDRVDKLCQDVTKLVKDKPESINRAAARVAITNKTEQARAYNYGYVLTCLSNGKSKFQIYSDSPDVSQDSIQYLGSEILINDGNILTIIPPFRTNSRLKIKVMHGQ